MDVVRHSTPTMVATSAPPVAAPACEVLTYSLFFFNIILIFNKLSCIPKDYTWYYALLHLEADERRKERAGEKSKVKF